jgi:lipopolysaccharide export system permease protein
VVGASYSAGCGDGAGLAPGRHTLAFQENHIMNILDRHIGTTIAVTTSLAMVLLLAFFFFASFVGELDAVGQGRYGLLQAFEFVLLTLPNLAYQLFPVVALLGSIIGLGILANSNELTAMRAAGVSIWRIAGSVMKVALLLVAATTIVGEWFAPPSEKYAQELRRTALEKRYVITKANGLWAREGRNFIHIRDVLADNMMGGVSIYEFDEAHQLRAIIQAQAADLENNVWVLRNVTQNQIGAPLSQPSISRICPVPHCSART